MLTKALLTAFLASLTASTPLERRLNSSSPFLNSSSPFSVITIHSGSVIQDASVQANGGKFWINLPTSSYCPEEVAHCPAGNETLFLPPSHSGTLPLSVSVPGGQQVYVGPDHALSYTVAHSADIPSGSTTSVFEYKPQDGEGHVGSLKLNGHDFFACALNAYQAVDGNSVFQIFGGDEKPEGKVNCISVLLGTSEREGVGAWEYA
ncbi:hypothetical protein ACMFMG_000635 [Clarireedia jacksonii]